MKEVKLYSGNGLMFKENGEDRLRIQDMQEYDENHEDYGNEEWNMIAVYGENGCYHIHKSDIDDLLILLLKVKENNYKIDENIK